MKETIKQTARKYLGRAIVGAGLAFGSLGGNAYANLPIYQETRQAVNDLRENENQERESDKQGYQRAYDSRVNEGINKFNESISDGHFKLDEQKAVYGILYDAKRIAKSHGEIAQNEGACNLLTKIYQNFKKGDVSRLEGDLKNEGLNVRIERDSFSNRDTACMMALFGGLISLMGYGAVADRIREEQEGSE